MNSTASVGITPATRDDINWMTVALGAAVAFLLAFAIRAVNYQHPPITDELYHLLAAASWAADGSLAIADGEYRRASAFTKLVGAVHAMSNGDIDTIRLFAILLGSLLVAATYAWSRRFAGSAEAVVAASMLALMPGAVFLSQHIRFYSLHALVFFMIAAGVYSIVLGRVSGIGRAFVIVAVVLLTFLGVHLQVTTLIGISGIALWVLVVKYAVIIDWFRGSRLKLAAFALTLLGVASMLALNGGAVADLLALYQSSAMWNSGDGPTFYLNFYRDQFGAFWSLAPAAFVVAILVRPVPAIFCACIFGVAFVVQSFGGMRGERFLFYAMPFFAIVWGIAAAAVGGALHRWLSSAIGKIGSTPIIGKFGSTPVLVGVFGFLLLSTPAVVMTAKMALGRPASMTASPVYWDRYTMDWQAAGSYLRDLRAESDVLIVSQALHAQYYLGGFDYALSATALADVVSHGNSDGMDPRTGRRVIDGADALRQILNNNARGVVVIHRPAWRNVSRVNDDAADFIEAHMTSVDVPGAWGLLVFRWQALPAASQQ